MRTPYEIFEALQGRPYDPEKPFDPPYSVWFRQQRQEYLQVRPDARMSQIDGHFYEAELQRFFKWLDKRFMEVSR